MIDKVREYEIDNDYSNAIITLDKIITSLKLLDNEHTNIPDKVVFRSEHRDRTLHKKILEIKQKQLEMENRIDNLTFKIHKLDEIINDKSEGK